MALRPTSARWFELLTSRQHLTAVLESLADTGLVELESHSDASAAHLLPALRAALDEYRALAQRYRSFWPNAAGRALGESREPERLPREALERLKAWAADADPVIVELQQLSNQRGDLHLLAELLQSTDAELPELNHLPGAGPTLAGRVYALPNDAELAASPPAVLLLVLPAAHHRFVLAAGPCDQIAALDDAMAGLKSRHLPIPADLPGKRTAAIADVESRLDRIAERERELERRLASLAERHQLAGTLGDFQLIEWLVEEIPELAVTENFAWVTGWTSDPDGTSISAVLDARDLDHLLRFADPPAGDRPVILSNPSWAKPFELFPGLLGMPGADETDPSTLVALLAPLMFGFMFGDVGQGVVLIVAGLLLRRRLPALALLVPGGIASVVFGFCFGSVFASEAVIPALWLHPLEAPITVLAVTLAFGALVVVTGLLLDACQHHWCGLAGRWWLARSGLLVAFLALIAAIVWLPAIWFALAGVVWFVAGESLLATSDRWAHAGAAFGEAAESLLQMLVNTVSFVRVGAFALAHAGLSAAIVGVAQAMGDGATFWVVMVFGNLLIITLEGLVVGIQTTRLVLFEFFIRFLKAQGRQFRPLVAPQATAGHPGRHP
jgi:V/A-type H+-transporting ATPase subunit I